MFKKMIIYSVMSAENSFLKRHLRKDIGNIQGIEGLINPIFTDCGTHSPENGF